MISFPLSRVALAAAVILCAAACDRQPAPTAAQATPAAGSSVVFGEGFYKEEASPASALRWVQGNAALSVNVPAEGRYRLTFRPFTVFTATENTIEISVNGTPGGSFTTRVFDTANPAPATVDLSLRAGDNDLRLHSKGPEKRLGDTDARTPAYGLVVPVTVERAP